MGPATGTAAPAAAAVLARLRGRGFTLEVAGNRLWVSPADRMSPADVETVKRFRDDLFTLVAGEIGDAAADPDAEPDATRDTRDGRDTFPTFPTFPDRGQLGEHAASVADRRRALMADDGTPSPCTECGAPSLANGTRLCASCWETWQGGAQRRP